MKEQPAAAASGAAAPFPLFLDAHFDVSLLGLFSLKNVYLEHGSSWLVSCNGEGGGQFGGSVTFCLVFLWIAFRFNKCLFFPCTCDLAFKGHIV